MQSDYQKLKQAYQALQLENEQLKQEVQAFRTTCETHGIPALVERSRSGDGAHVWLLFAEKN